MHRRRTFVLALLGCLLAGWVISPGTAYAATVRHVATTGADTGDCSLNPCRTIQYAIGQSSSGDTIRVAAGSYAEHLTVGLSLTLRGAGPKSTIVDGSRTGRVVTVTSSSASLNVRISGLTITGGFATLGAGIASLPATGMTNRVTLSRLLVSENVATAATGITEGGGIYNGTRSRLTVSESTVRGNSATGASASCGSSGLEGCTGSGGGIENAGVLTLTRTTVSENAAMGGHGGVYCHYPQGGLGYRGGDGLGGGIDGGGSLVNSTVSGNSATGGNGGTPAGLCGPHRFPGAGGDGDGGGIDATRSVSLINATVAGNQAFRGSGSPLGLARGGGLYAGSSSVQLTNTIVANNMAIDGLDCLGTVHSHGHNLVGHDAFCDGFTGPGDLVNVDPVLGALQDNGGPTFTEALLPGSPAIDAADDAVCAAPPVGGIDQRGYPRPGGPHCDIGSFEAQ